jgi:hypothetical protein
MDIAILQRFALKPKPREILKALLCNAFKISLVVRYPLNFLHVPSSHARLS